MSFSFGCDNGRHRRSWFGWRRVLLWRGLCVCVWRAVPWAWCRRMSCSFDLCARANSVAVQKRWKQAASRCGVLHCQPPRLRLRAKGAFPTRGTRTTLLVSTEARRRFSGFAFLVLVAPEPRVRGLAAKPPRGVAVVANGNLEDRSQVACPDFVGANARYISAPRKRRRRRAGARREIGQRLRGWRENAPCFDTARRRLCFLPVRRYVRRYVRRPAIPRRKRARLSSAALRRGFACVGRIKKAAVLHCFCLHVGMSLRAVAPNSQIFCDCKYRSKRGCSLPSF